MTVAVALTPKASRNAITGVAETADGDTMLSARVTAAPENGKANTALIKLLSKEWKLPKSDFSVRIGAANRRKVIEIAGSSAALTTKLNTWIAHHV
ncbi:MAG: DUF167 family protein [Alphaproteobacteria bacterium]